MPGSKHKVLSLRRSLYRLVILPVLLMLVLLLGIIVLSNQLVLAEIEAEQAAVAQTIARSTWQYLDDTQVVLRNLGEMLLYVDASQRDVLVSDTHHNYPRFNAIYVLDGHGKVLNESKLADTPSLLGFDLSGEAYFKALKETREAYFSNSFFSISTGDVAVTVAQPIFRDDIFAGVVVGELSLSDLQAKIQNLAVNPEDVVFVVDKRGNLVAHPDRDLVRQQVHVGPLEMVRPETGSHWTRIVQINDEWVFATAARIENGWVVVTSRPLWLALLPFFLLAGISLLVLLAGVVVLSFGIQRSVRRISMPVSRLAEKAEAIARGQYTPLEATTPHEEYQEINALNLSFNKMVETIRTRTNDLLATNLQLKIELDERQRIEAALRNSEMRYRSLFENTPIAIWEEDFSEARILLDQYKQKYKGDWQACLAENPGLVMECAEKVRVLAVNQAALMLHGARSQEELLTNLSQIFTEDTPVAFLHELESIWLDRQSADTEGRIRTLSGDIRYVMARWSVLPDRDRPYDRVMLSLVDITAYKKAEMALQQHREHLEELVRERTEKLERANQELESFAYTVSHDLRAPLRHIDGYSNILAAEYANQLDEQGQFFLANVRKAVQNMSRMIDGLLQLSRTSRGELMYADVDLSSLAREIADDLSNAEPERAVVWDIMPGCQAYGDPRLLRVTLQNLLHNAWKFTQSRQPAQIEFGCLKPESGASASMTVFFVRDNGAGFDMKYASKLFTPFQRLHSEEQFSGTGIGLATVQRIVRRHGGDIWVESQPEAGATFFFSLPQK